MVCRGFLATGKAQFLHGSRQRELVDRLETVDSGFADHGSRWKSAQRGVRRFAIDLNSPATDVG